ncbi:MAG: FtsW/RodA/SpoVE family cell cycle protein [Oscillospiraceae bacterium]|nr:FtsW/RodA/SpoVE family cell cycle protein [Oscillospiraceae bacterium]
MKNIFKAVAKYFKQLDKLLLLAVCLCTTLGIVLLYSLGQTDYLHPDTFKTQLFSMLAGIAASLVIAAIDYKKISKLWFLYVPAALVLVILTFTSMGVGVSGTDDVAWLKLGPVTFQPAEILKIAFLLSFSYHLYKVRDSMNNLINTILLCIHGAIPVALVLKQGDYGTALVFLAMFLVMIYSAGISIGYILLAVIAIPPALFFAWKYVLGSVHKERILILFNPGSDPEGIEWQQDLGLNLLASGGITGNGLCNADYREVPEMHNDFIFSYVGYVFGFAGCVALIALMAYICIKIIADSRKTREELGKNICVGAFAMIFTHCVLNVGMVLKIMPVIGVPIPFVSAGGTALLSMYVMMGFVLSTRVHNEKVYRMFEWEK